MRASLAVARREHNAPSLWPMLNIQRLKPISMVAPRTGAAL
jgi:hypothetical protein